MTDVSHDEYLLRKCDVTVTLFFRDSHWTMTSSLVIEAIASPPTMSCNRSDTGPTNRMMLYSKCLSANTKGIYNNKALTVV